MANPGFKFPDSKAQVLRILNLNINENHLESLMLIHWINLGLWKLHSHKYPGDWDPKISRGHSWSTVLGHTFTSLVSEVGFSKVIRFSSPGCHQNNFNTPSNEAMCILWIFADLQNGSQSQILFTCWNLL